VSGGDPFFTTTVAFEGQKLTMFPPRQRVQADRIGVMAPRSSTNRSRRTRPLRFASFLAPNMFSTHQWIVRRLATKLGKAIEFFSGSSYLPLATEIDAAFVCGMAYVELARKYDSPIEPLAAPVLQGERYGGRPVYFSDVIVRRDRWFRSFADLRGCCWCYNEPLSHSGYGITCYELACRGETRGFFGKVVQAGYHERSIALVCSGEVDASAIDSQVLAMTLRDQPQRAAQIRVIDSFGPSTIQPFVVARRLPKRLRADLLTLLVEMGDDPAARAVLALAFIDRFVPVCDSSYDDIRHMLRTAETGAMIVPPLT
jgi:phosphonate transport system substrate-binding protein